MPGTPQEMVAFVCQLGSDPIVTAAPDEWRWADGTAIVGAEWTDLLTLHAYRLRMLIQRPNVALRAAQRKAGRLLRRFLSTAQRAELSRLGYFYVTTPSGATYRLIPRRGHAERVERHKSRYFVKRSYCIHDDPRDEVDPLPPADLTLAHLLLLLADEPAFLATANESRRDDQLWNRDYLRRMRRRHSA